jgi:RNA polymerase sigma-70 factor (ECF subfamily)
MGDVDQQAIRQVLGGDRDAYRVLMERHFATIYRVTFRITGNEQDAEEAAQEAFLRAYNKLPEFRHNAGFGTWVYRIAMNCALNLVERRGREASWNAAPLVTEQGAEMFASASGRGPEQALLDREASWNAAPLETKFGIEKFASKSQHGPEQALLDGEAVHLRERAMRQLTPMERAAFVLRHMEDQPIGEIAAALGVPANSAKQAVFRAVGKLRRALRTSAPLVKEMR